jgi:peptidoglycan/LPS O-acetylase OafA/YrhL
MVSAEQSSIGSPGALLGAASGRRFQAEPREEIKSLTSLRGIAAMAVVLQHFSATAQRYCVVTIPSLAPHGYMAVDLFFVLSGFIMSYTYLASFEALGLRAFPGFLGRRVARVVPLNLAVLFALVLMGAASVALLGYNMFFHSDHLIRDLLANALMLQGLGIGTNLNGPSWSISTEFAAYLAFPLFVYALFHRRGLIAGASLAVAVGVLCWLAILQPHLGLGIEDTGKAVLRCFTEFVMGMGAYRLYRSTRFRDLLASDGAAFGLSAAVAIILILGIDLLAALLFPFVVLVFAWNRGLANRLMSSRVPYFLGVVSYSIYLIHNAFRPMEMALLQAWHPAPLGAVAALTFALIGSLSVIPFAWLAYRTVERPGRKAVRGLLGSVALTYDRAGRGPGLRPDPGLPKL